MNRPVNQTSRRIVLILAIGLFIVTLGGLGMLGPLRGLYDGTLGPIAAKFGSIGQNTSNFSRDIIRVGGLVEENDSLKDENAMLRQRLAADSETRQDNTELRQQLGLGLAVTQRQVGAEVISFQPDAYRQFVTINRGTSDGVEVGQAVLAKGVMAGLVFEVAKKSSKVRLISDPEFRLAAKIATKNADGTLQGKLGGGLLMNKIDKASKISPGDTVTSAGLGGKVPAGLLIGQVQSVDSREDAIFQSAELTSALDAKRLQFMFVVIP